MDYLFKGKYETRTTRIRGYDYSLPGFYFVTACVHGFKHCLSSISSGQISLSEIGRAVDSAWLAIPRHFENVELDEYVIMPNHVHGLLKIKAGNETETQDVASLQRNSQLSSIIRGWKIGSVRNCREIGEEIKWQARFFDRVVRDEEELSRVRQYIINNPIKWELEKNESENIGQEFI